MLFTAALGLLLVMRSSANEKRSPSPPSDTAESGQLSIVSSGIFALMPDAMGITFYIDLINNMPLSLDVATRMWECCESYDEGEVDCSHIHLIGGYKGILSPGDSRNVTLFYPNLYVYNRVGECLVGVWYREPNGKVNELRAKVNFDTTLTPRHVAPAISAYYEAEISRVRKCIYIDEDPLNKCKPVDCSRKYNGQRMFYSTVERRCLAAPKCNDTNNRTDDSQGKIDLPAFVYAPEGNFCENQEPIINEDDIRTLNSGRGVDQELHPSNEYDFIVCHHGNKSQFTGHCRCHEGWYSSTSHIRPTTLKVHLCTEAQFETRSTFGDTFAEISGSVHLLVPRFVEALSKPALYKFQGIVCGSTLLMSLLFSLTFTLVYRGKLKAKKVVVSKKITEKLMPVRKILKRVDLNKEKKLTDEESSTIADKTTDNDQESTPEETDTLLNTPTYYSEIRNPKYSFYNNPPTKMQEYITDFVRNPSNSIGFSTRTIPSLQFSRFTTSSMTPREKLLYLGHMQDHLPLNETSPLLRHEYQDINRGYTKAGIKVLTKIPERNIKVNQYSSSRKKTTSSSARGSILTMRKRNTPGVAQPKRRKAGSSFSRSMARLTYSTLPSSDSLITLIESSETASPCTSSDEK